MNHPILAPASAPRWRVYTRLVELGAAPLFLDEMVEPLWAAGVEHGIDPVLMVAQAAHETGYGRFGGAVGPLHFNTCGLKTRAGGANNDPLAHAQFASWQTGARAHAQHLLAYAGNKLLPGEELVDPRWVWVVDRHNVTYVEELGEKWAPSRRYGVTVGELMERLK